MEEAIEVFKKALMFKGIDLSQTIEAERDTVTGSIWLTQSDGSSAILTISKFEAKHEEIPDEELPL